jgi:hypothetical protein
MKTGMIRVLWKKERAYQSVTNANLSAIPLAIKEEYLFHILSEKGYPEIFDLLKNS